MNLLDDPNKAGILSLGLRLMSTPGKFGSALGQAGLGAMGDIQQAKQAQAMARQKALQEQMLMMQLEQIKAQQAKQQGIEGAYRGAFESPATQAMAGGGGPTVANAQGMQGMQPRINQQKLIEQLMQVDPMSAYQMMQPKASDYKVVGDSLVEIGGGKVKEAYRAPQKPDLNSLIVMGPDGKPTLNTMLMDAKKAIAGAGATSVSVGGGQFENSFSKASGTKFAEVYDGINTDGMIAGQQIANLGRMEQLLQGVEGGKLAPTGKEIASVAKTFGVTLDPNLGNKEAAESLSREMALAMRKPGTGPMTDKDFENFMLIVPSLSKTANGRAEITATLRAKAQRDIQMAQLAQKYVAERGVLDTGFYSLAQQFIAKNPVVKAGSAQPVPMPSMADIEAELRKRNK